MSEDPYEGLEKSLPSSPDTERAFLGSIFLDNSLIFQAVEVLPPEQNLIYSLSYRVIYEAMIELYKVGAPLDYITVGEELRRAGNYEMAGEGVGITGTTYGVMHVSNLEPYAKIIRGKALLRNIIKTAAKMSAEALEEEEQPELIYDHACTAIFNIGKGQQSKGFSSIGSLTHTSLEKAYTIQQTGHALTGVTSGLADLDELTLGWQKSDLIIVAGRPSAGKTSLGLQMAMAAAKSGKKVAFFSLEMSESQLAMRSLCCEAGVDSRKFQSGYLSDPEWLKLGIAHEALNQTPLVIDDTARNTVLKMRAKAMRWISENGPLDEIVIDYLQIMGLDEIKKGQSREREVADMAGGLKALAKELNLPVILLSQLSRKPEDRTNHRPQLADLRESGAIEQDADVVTFVYRGDQYKGKEEAKDNVAELIVAKQRNGLCDTVYARYEPAFTKFSSLVKGAATQ